MRRKRAHLPCSPPGGPASCQFGRPTCDAAQWRLSAAAGPAPQGTPANERLARAGRALCPPPPPSRPPEQAVLGWSEVRPLDRPGGSAPLQPSAGRAATAQRGRQTPAVAEAGGRWASRTAGTCVRRTEP